MRSVSFTGNGRIAAAVAIGVAALMSTGTARAVGGHNLSFYLSQPQSQTTIFTNTTTETFNSLSAGNRTTDYVSAIGTYSMTTTGATRFNIQADNQYGSGTGNYMAIGAQSGSSSPLTLTFTTAQSYFGFSWNAGDVNNGITFYSGSTVIGRFTSASLIAKLSGTTVTALNGSTYTSKSYYGKPGATTTNSGEPYAFVNFIDDQGTFDKLVFDNSGTTGTGFETDNHTIKTTAPAPDNSFVFVGTVGAPEPASFALLLPALSLLPMLRKRSHRR